MRPCFLGGVWIDGIALLTGRATLIQIVSPPPERAMESHFRSDPGEEDGAAKGGFEPKLTDAARFMNVCFKE